MNRNDRKFQILEIELTNPVPEVRVSEGYCGFAFILRRDDQPVGFFIEPMPAKRFLSSKELAAKIMSEAANRLLEESVYEELSPASNSSSFPALTIAICTRNHSDILMRCIHSILRVCQLGSDIEILIVDNAPSDRSTAEAVAKMSGVRYVMEPKPGLDFARNRAVSDASGELLAFLDDDVVIDRSWLVGLKRAWQANPDACAFTGPVLPFELATGSQIAFEQMGGFGRNFYRTRFGADLADSSSYPCGAGMFGCGCNMVFRRAALLALGGFDEALDTGSPLPGGGDLDMFYRVIRAGYALVSEPSLMVYHQHRRDYQRLRHQMWTWGLGTMAFVVKTYRTDPTQRAKLKRWVAWWFVYQFSKILVPFLRKNRKPWPFDLVIAEIAGGIKGLIGEYDRSLSRVERRRKMFA